MSAVIDQVAEAASNAAALEAMAQRVDELPLLPQSLVNLLQLDPDEDDYFDRFEELAREDPALAVKIVGFANSAASAPMSPILSIQAALARMGVQPIRSLVASLSVQRVFTPVESSQVDLWKHSIAVGTASQRIAMLLKSLDIEPGFAYLAGLLHDVGRFVMLEHASADLLRVDESNWHTGDDLLAADLEVFLFTHSELGYLACQRWGLPDEVADVVRSHHDTLELPIAPGTGAATNLCVQVADWLDLAIFSNDALDDAPCDELAAIIADDCPIVETLGNFIDPQALSLHLPAMRSDANDLLSGLGFG